MVGLFSLEVEHAEAGLAEPQVGVARFQDHVEVCSRRVRPSESRAANPIDRWEMRFPSARAWTISVSVVAAYGAPFTVLRSNASSAPRTTNGGGACAAPTVTTTATHAAVRATRLTGAQERVEQRPDGLVRITLKKAYPAGTIAVDMDPLSLLCRLGHQRASSSPAHHPLRGRAGLG